MNSPRIDELASRLERREISPLEVVEDCISRINQVNMKLNAFVTVAADSARRDAKVAEEEIRAGKYRGPLHGIPIGIKDIIDTSNIRTTYGSAIFRNHVPVNDAAVVSRLKEAGAIILGKTNTHEFAFGITTNNVHYGPTRNPWDPTRIPGGSSGGSAAAVAASLCSAALGTDTGGSVRIPSAFCGVVGLKPTYGRISTSGVFPLATGMDHVGTIASSATDNAIILQALAGFDESDPRTLMIPVPNFSDRIDEPIEGVTVATCPNLIPDVIDAQVHSAYQAAIRKVESLGAQIIERNLKAAEFIQPASTKLLLAEAATQHSELLMKHSEEYDTKLMNRFKLGEKVTTPEYIQALRDSEVVQRSIEILFKDADVLMTPTIQILPPRIGEETVAIGSEQIDMNVGCVRFARLANITGIPAIALPYGYSKEDLPLSIQLMVPRLHEANLLRMANAIEKATPELRNRSPPLFT
jgi:aspartyl-tRNA(Asn)/glutamyl-tRNA(Gln) amidotransferase subunit A